MADAVEFLDDCRPSLHPAAANVLWAGACWHGAARAECDPTKNGAPEHATPRRALNRLRPSDCYAGVLQRTTSASASSAASCGPNTGIRLTTHRNTQSSMEMTARVTTISPQDG